MDRELERELVELRMDVQFFLDQLWDAADTPDTTEMVTAQQFARNVLDDWSK